MAPILLIAVLLIGPSALAAAPDTQWGQREALEAHEPGEPGAPADLESGVDAYIAAALAHNPQVKAAYARWDASVRQIARGRSLPEPTLGFGIYLQSVETRVGPQQARISLQQAFPWPTSLSAGTDAATHEARAAQAAFDGVALSIAADVQEAYWNLWEIRANRRTHKTHLEVLDGLSSTLRARVEVGGASLADLQQIDLSRARLADRIATMDERERAAEARLRAHIGRRGTDPMPTTVGPAAPQLPVEGPESLGQSALERPDQQQGAAKVQAAEARIRQAGAQRLPGFTLGADWILTGPAEVADMPDSGKDAVVLGAGLRLPLWQARYAKEVRAARSQATAMGADQQSRGDRALAEVTGLLSAVRDTARRSELTANTLLPQAEATYTSLLGGYASGQNAIAQVLLAQRDLLDLRVQLDQARADHSRAWAALDEAVGLEVARRPATEESL